MTTRKIELKREPARWREMSRKIYLAYLGAFGVASDELTKLFKLFIERGERMDRSVLKQAKRGEKQVRKFAARVEKEQKATIKRAAKKAQAIA
jgi:hypothetical protein